MNTLALLIISTAITIGLIVVCCYVLYKGKE